MTGRKNVPKGPFWMGTAGFAVNAIAVVLIVFFNIMFMFRMLPLNPSLLEVANSISQHMYIPQHNQR